MKKCPEGKIVCVICISTEMDPPCFDPKTGYCPRCGWGPKILPPKDLNERSVL